MFKVTVLEHRGHKLATFVLSRLCEVGPQRYNVCIHESEVIASPQHFTVLSPDQNSRFYGAAKFGQIPEKIWEMTISKATFAPSTPFTIHLECLESRPNDSTRVRRLASILRRARVTIFILAYGSFWLELSGFSSNLTGHHETKTAKPIWSC